MPHSVHLPPFLSVFNCWYNVQVKALCKIIPRQVRAEKAVAVIRRTVEELITKCKEIVEAEGERIDEEEYINDTDPSILRFLLASRAEVS